MRYLKRQDISTYTYYCPFHHTFGCPVKIRLDFSKSKCDMYGNGQHTVESHKQRICKPKRCSAISGGKRNLSEELCGSSEDGAKAFTCEDGFRAAQAGGTIRRKKAVGNPQSRFFFMILLCRNVFTSFFPTMRHVASTWIKWFV